jgi:hypothetical protein
MRRLALLTTTAAVILTGCQATSSAGHAAKVSTVVAGTTPDATPAPVASPSVHYHESCDYILGSGLSLTAKFVARAELHNDGNIGTVDQVKASWVQVGSHDITSTKTVRTPTGSHKVVNFSLLEGQDQISALQAYNGLHDCKIKVTMVRQFGQPK